MTTPEILHRAANPSGTFEVHVYLMNDGKHYGVRAFDVDAGEYFPGAIIYARRSAAVAYADRQADRAK